MTDVSAHTAPVQSASQLSENIGDVLASIRRLIAQEEVVEDPKLPVAAPPSPVEAGYDISDGLPAGQGAGKRQGRDLLAVAQGLTRRRGDRGAIEDQATPLQLGAAERVELDRSAAAGHQAWAAEPHATPQDAQPFLRPAAAVVTPEAETERAWLEDVMRTAKAASGAGPVPASRGEPRPQSDRSSNIPAKTAEHHQEHTGTSRRLLVDAVATQVEAGRLRECGKTAEEPTSDPASEGDGFGASVANQVKDSPIPLRTVIGNPGGTEGAGDVEQARQAQLSIPSGENMNQRLAEPAAPDPSCAGTACASSLPEDDSIATILREMIRGVIRQELHGNPSSRFSQDIRLMILREVAQVLASPVR